MNEDAEPNWSLLPENPAEFFGLSGGFDLRSLKSRYSSLIRRYKPESSPAEFQRIRAAFEILKSRFQQEPSAPPPPAAFDWDEVFPERKPASPSPEPRSQRQQNHKPHPLDSPQEEKAELPQTRDPRGRYEEHLRRGQKSPHDYYALAILSDIVDTDQLGFAGWLLAGLAQYRRDQALFILLHEFFSTPEAARDANDLLVATASVVSDDRFYDLTLPLWEHLVRTADVQLFQQLLDECESRLEVESRERRLAFYIWIHKQAYWSSFPDWIVQRLAALDTCDLELSDQAERDRHVLDFLAEYREHRRYIIGISEVCRDMDQVIVAFTSRPREEADQQLEECQTRIAQLGDRLAHQLPYPEPALGILLNVWELITSDTEERLGISPLAEPPDTEQRTKQLAGELMWSGLWRGFQFGMYVGWGGSIAIQAFLLIWVASLIIGAIMVVVGAIKDRSPELLFILLLFAGMGFAARWIWQLVRRESATAFRGHCTRYYCWTWRKQIVRFLQRNAMSRKALVLALVFRKGRLPCRPRLHGAKWIAECISDDSGLEILRLAQNYVAKQPPESPT